jgi:hypothetical protein
MYQMDDSTSPRSQRRRVRRGIGLVVAATLFSGLALAPATQADSNPLGGLDLLLQGIFSGLPNTLGHPVGDGAGTGGCPRIDGVGTLGTCVVDPLGPNRAKQARIKATMKNGKLRSLRLAH